MSSTENMPRIGDEARGRNKLEFDKFDAFFKTRAFMRTGGPVTARDVRFDPNDSAPIYIGVNETQNALTASTDWIVYKFSYDGANVTRIQIAMGSWDGRAGLF